MDNCLFCKIIKKEIDCKLLYEDDDLFVFLDIDQSTPGHTLIIPKEHIDDFTGLSKDLLNKMFLMAKMVSKVLMEKLNKKGVSLLFNYGEAQEVKHVHLHILPDYYKENKEMSIEEVYELIKDEF